MSDFPPVTPEYMAEWGKHARTSPLYHHLVDVIANDQAMLRVINRIEHRPPPNMLFAAVQYLLMQDPAAPLRDFYPNLVPETKPLTDIDQQFTAFVLDHEKEIVRIGNTRYTQTNECKRCTALLPGVWASGWDRFHLIEIGASAGLNLALDHYHYRWGDVEWGPQSPVVLEAESRGGQVQPREIDVVSRTGIDLNPIDATDPEERAWLLALVWPEHDERRQRLEKALGVVEDLQLDLVEGSLLDTLPDILARIPPDEPVIVMNSMVLMQLSRPEREDFGRLIEQARQRRDIRRVSLELLAAGDEWITLGVDLGAGLAQVGRAQSHGEWVELYARP